MTILLHLPSALQADYQIAPNPNYGTIYVTALDAVNLATNGVFENKGTIMNSGTITNSGWLGNFGSLDNSGTLNNYLGLSNGYILSNSGTLNNYVGASLVTYTGASLYNYGKLINYGWLVEDRGTLNNYNTLDNYGTLTNRGHLLNYCILNSYAGSSLINTRELQNYRTMNIYGTFSNSDKYARVINAGTLIIDGTYIQTAGTTVNNENMTATSLMINGGKLAGTGIINSSVTIGSGAMINPGVDGPPTGTLTINGPLVSSGTLFFDIRGLGDGESDVLDVNDDITFTGGNVTFNFQSGYYNPTKDCLGFYWDFLLVDNISGWDTLNFNMIGLPNGLDWNINDVDGGKQLVITGFTPLPGAIWLLAPALVVIGLVKRKKSQGLSKNR
ncbi:hypothetical protein [Macellibacteroides fermentans]|uniref:hypothetical protein n=1 Tax=Macellibacteroides fermentans TaxID=879969 RepID=UPI00406CFDAE